MTPKQIDHSKLHAMRDAHARLHAQYRDLAERARTAKGDVAQLRSFAPSGTPEQKAIAARFLALPIAELQAVTPETLQAVRIDPRYVQRLIAAHSRAQALAQEAAELAPALRRSGLLISKVNEYANSREQL